MLAEICVIQTKVHRDVSGKETSRTQVIILKNEILQKIEQEKEKLFEKQFYEDLYNAGHV